MHGRKLTLNEVDKEKMSYLEDADGETRTRNPWITNQCSSHRAIQLKSYCWEGVEFIQLVYCIITYLSFLNCD